MKEYTAHRRGICAAIRKGYMRRDPVRTEERSLDLERVAKLPEIPDELVERERALRIVCPAVSAQVDGDGMVASGKFGDESPPVGFDGAEQSGEEYQGLPGAVLFIVDGRIVGEDE